jgi:hypothetical protein
MMRGWRALAIVPVAAKLMTGTALSAQAQDGTPSADQGENPRLVDPSECKSNPLAVDKLTTILGLDAQGVPQPEYTTITPPLGTVVDNATAISIKEAAREVLACFNAGDIPRAAALMTDNGIKRSYWGLTINDQSRQNAKELLAKAATARSADQAIRLIAVTDASTLPDGRVAAFLVINEPLLPPSGPETLLFIFKNEDGTWKVDDFVDFSIVPPQGTPEATPAS